MEGQESLHESYDKIHARGALSEIQNLGASSLISPDERSSKSTFKSAWNKDSDDTDQDKGSKGSPEIMVLTSNHAGGISKRWTPKARGLETYTPKGILMNLTRTPSKHLSSPSYNSRVTFTPLNRNRIAEMLRENKNRTPSTAICRSPSVSMACSTLYNPFDRVSADLLQLPAVSPHLFTEVVSPNEKEDPSFAWSIDQVAILRPTNINTSPWDQLDIPTDSDYERSAQEAIDRFFNAATIVPSPWTGSSQSNRLASAILSSEASSSGNGSNNKVKLLSNASPSLASPLVVLQTSNFNSRNTSHVTKVSSVWSQTELTFPPVLPKELQDALAPFCTFKQGQTWDQFPSPNEPDDEINPDNTTLRRKLLFDQEDLANATSSSNSQDQSGIMGSSRESSADGDPQPLDNEDEEPLFPWNDSPQKRLSLCRNRKRRCSQSYVRYSFGSWTSPEEGSNNKQAFSGEEIPQISLINLSPIKKHIETIPSHQDPQSRSSQLEMDTYYPLSISTDDLTIQQVPFDSTQITHSHPCNSSFNSSLLRIHSQNCEDVLDENLSSKSPGAVPDSEHLASSSQDSCSRFSCGNELISRRSSFPIKKQRKTPRQRKTIHICSHSKSSPQFSSSPIKGNSTSSSLSSLCRCHSFKSEEEEERFTHSPSISPIGSLGTKYSVAHQSDVDYLREELKNQIEPTAVQFTRNSSEMDVDSLPYLEGSTMDEATQDTGYQTGLQFSLHNTNKAA